MKKNHIISLYLFGIIISVSLSSIAIQLIKITPFYSSLGNELRLITKELESIEKKLENNIGGNLNYLINLNDLKEFRKLNDLENLKELKELNWIQHRLDVIGGKIK